MRYPLKDRLSFQPPDDLGERPKKCQCQFAIRKEKKMSESIFDTIKKGIVLLDGGMGTELIAHGFPQGACPETWNVEKPEVVKKIHTSYYEAGSDVVLTNSFGGSRLKLEDYGLGRRCYELNRAAAEIAVQVRPERRFVAGSMGPIGKFLKPAGEFEREQFIEAYAEQARGLSDGGADFLLVETQYDLQEAICALSGARNVTDKPVFVTMTFTKGPRGYFTIMGNSVARSVEELEEEKVPVIGTNCTLNSEEMVDLVKIIRECTELPIIAQANAGQPTVSGEGEVSYAQKIEDYIRFIPQLIENGANLIGGCCGTNPEYIKRMAEIIKKK
jgi:5-methyltetrahydrofolate--homocysteine methyltransferase